jgi:glycosyltransferase involved in cell wall biosynthesis
LKILYVDQTGQLGGGELSLLDVIKNSEHEAEVALFSDGPFRAALEQLNVRVHLLSLGKVGEIRKEGSFASSLSGMPALLRLRKELAALANRFDVVYANSQKAFLLGALARKRRQKLIWHLRDMLTADHFSPFMRRAAVLAGNMSASTVIVNSEATLESFAMAGGRRDKAVVVYNGISAKPFDTITDSDVERLRKEFGVEGKFVLGVFGRLSPWKGQDVVIDALPQLPDAHVFIVGEALFGEQAFAEGLRTRARLKGVEDRVHFLGFRRDIPALMKSVDVVVHSSTAPEPFGRVIVEAMLAERPVIATRAGGVVEIVENENTGLLVTPGSADELAAAIMRVMSDVNLSRKLVQAGKARACSVFSTDAMMKGINRVLDATNGRNRRDP